MFKRQRGTTWDHHEQVFGKEHWIFRVLPAIALIMFILTGTAILAYWGFLGFLFVKGISIGPEGIGQMFGDIVRGFRSGSGF